MDWRDCLSDASTIETIHLRRLRIVAIGQTLKFISSILLPLPGVESKFLPSHNPFYNRQGSFCFDSGENLWDWRPSLWTPYTNYYSSAPTSSLKQLSSLAFILIYSDDSTGKLSRFLREDYLLACLWFPFVCFFLCSLTLILSPNKLCSHFLSFACIDIRRVGLPWIEHLPTPQAP